MSLCPVGKKPVIKWQYSGEEENRIIGADDYSITEQKNYCPGIRYKLNYSRAIILNGTLSGWTNFSTELPSSVQGKAPYTNIRLTAQGIEPPYDVQYYYGTPIFHWAFQNQGLKPNGSRSRTYQIILNSTNQQNQIILNSSTSGVRIDSIEPVDSQAICPSSKVFNVIKDNKIVYSKINAIAPTVSHYCQDDNECPPGTCECTNGSTVCCYDTKTGKVVKSFTR